MSRLTTIGVLAVIVSLASCVSPEAHHQVLSANDALRKQLMDLQRVCDEQQGEVRRLEHRFPLRIGRPLATDLAPSSAGSWQARPAGGWLWRLRVRSEGEL